MSDQSRRMKTAKKKFVAVELYCPHCEADMPAPGGQLYWDVNEIESKKEVRCVECGKPFLLPVIK